jgi:D,D-heptose 1,7-bisphosphate phosphatase
MTPPVRQACILVGGKGTRLGDITRSVPKPLLNVYDGVAFLDFIIEQLVRQGFNDIILLAGYLGHLVEARYRHSVGSYRVRILVEPEPRGTAGALQSAHEMLASRFLLLNGDSFFDTNLRSLVAKAVTLDCDGLVAVRRVADGSRYGTVTMAGDQITDFREKDPNRKEPALINAGTYVLTSSIIERVHSLPCSIEAQIFPRLAAEGKLSGAIRDGYFLDIGLPETLEQGRRELSGLRHRPAVFLERDVTTIDYGYLDRPDQFHWIAGAQNAVRLLNDLGYRVVVVTNQVGAARGYYGEDSVRALHSWMQDCLAAEGAFIDAFYYCPHPKTHVGKFRASRIDRKPSPGLILRALSELSIDSSRSFLIGDKESDLEAACHASIRGFLFGGGDLVAFIRNCLARVAPEVEHR